MSQLRKLYDRALRNPGSVRFEDLDRLLRRWGCVRRQPGRGSSHYVYTLGGVMLTVVRQGGSVKPIYVRRAMEALEGLDIPEEDDDAPGSGGGQGQR